MRHAILLLLLLAVCGAAYALLAPAEVNGDGVGYLNQVSGRGLSPGHLAYVPLVRRIADAWGYAVLYDLVTPLRGLSILSALLALAFFFDTARRSGGAGPALFVTALLGASYGFARSAMEIESYAPSVLLVVAALWAVVRYAEAPARGLGLAVLAGLFAGAAVHLHLTLVLLAPSIAVLILLRGPPGRRTRDAFAVLLVMGVVVLVPLAIALRRAGVEDLPAAWAWLMSSDHGIPYPRPWLGPFVSAWGIIRSLVHVPYPYEAGLLVVAASSVAGAAGWLALLLLRHRSRHRASVTVDFRFVLVWSAPLALFAMVFYPSDTERWIFVLPALFLWLRPAASRAGVAFVVLVALANAGSGFVPAALDREPVDRAEAADRLLTARDLVVAPGHGWEELVGLSARNPAEVFPLIFHVGAQEDLDGAVDLMRERIRRTFDTGGRVFVARLEGSEDPRGFKELVWFGMDGNAFAALFLPYDPRPTLVRELWELSPAR